MFKQFGSLALISAGLLMTGCSSSDDNDTQAPEAKSFSLDILHINDHHSFLDPQTGITLNLAGEPTGVEVGGFPRIVSAFNELSAGKSNVLKLHAGDAMTGTLYYSLFEGEADAAMMNQVCFDAFALGNHEFDRGDAGLKKFLDALNKPLCQTPVLAANVVPQVGTPLAPAKVDDYIKPYIIKQYADEKVAVIGIDIKDKTLGSSRPDATTQFLDERETAQRYIDEVKALGVNKIVLLTHYQYQNDMVLATQLSGVDVIVGGDSHSLLGEGFDALGLNPAGPYPTQATNADGHKVCIVQAWQYSTVVGELNVTFDSQGRVDACSGTPHMLLGSTFTRNGEELANDAKNAVLAAIEGAPELRIQEADAATATLLNEYSSQVSVLKQAQIGQAADNLCLVRIPGEARSKICDVSETRARGADISNLVAQAFRYQALDADMAIQNAGGVRIDIPAGPISIGTAYELLPFANTLVNLSMTGAEIHAVLEDAVDYAILPGGSSGAYPYASGLRYDVDLSKAKGQRVFNLEVKGRKDTLWSSLETAKTYVVVTNNFIASGKDGYTTFGVAFNEGRVVDTFLDYAQSFVDYVREVGTLSKPAAEDYSTQHFYDKDGILQQ